MMSSSYAMLCHALFCRARRARAFFFFTARVDSCVSYVLKQPRIDSAGFKPRFCHGDSLLSEENKRKAIALPPLPLPPPSLASYKVCVRVFNWPPWRRRRINEPSPFFPSFQKVLSHLKGSGIGILLCWWHGWTFRARTKRARDLNSDDDDDDDQTLRMHTHTDTNTANICRLSSDDYTRIIHQLR